MQVSRSQYFFCYLWSRYISFTRSNNIRISGQQECGKCTHLLNDSGQMQTRQWRRLWFFNGWRLLPAKGCSVKLQTLSGCSFFGFNFNNNMLHRSEVFINSWAWNWIRWFPPTHRFRHWIWPGMLFSVQWLLDPRQKLLNHVLDTPRWSLFPQRQCVYRQLLSRFHWIRQ